MADADTVRQGFGDAVNMRRKELEDCSARTT